MNRLTPLAALVAAACGSATDDRPATLEYITETILAPTCAQAACHSAFKAQVGDVFDTVEATRRTIVLNGLAVPADAEDPSNATLIRSLTVGLPSILDPDSDTLIRMPFVSPMPDADIHLIETWIAAGVPGAQCEPNDENRGCEVDTSGPLPVYRVVECPDGNIGAVVETCLATQVCVPSRENGRCQ